MTKIVRKASLTRDALRSIIVKNAEAVVPGLTLIDMQLGNEEEGIIEMLGTGPEGGVSLVDFECAPSDTLLLRLLSQAHWLKKNERLVRRLFFNQNFDFSQSPRLILVAPAFSPQCVSAARQILSHEITGVTYRYMTQGHDDAIMFEEAFTNRAGSAASRPFGGENAEEAAIPRDVATPFPPREPLNHVFPGEAALTAEEIAEFMDFDNKPA